MPYASIALALGGAALWDGLFGGDDAPQINTGLRQGGSAGVFNNFTNPRAVRAGGLATQNMEQILGQQGRTSPDLFNRILAGSSRGTESAQRNLSARGARSGVDSGIQDALAAAIDMEGADREAGIKATEASVAEDRKRQDVAAFTANVLDPILAALGIESGVAVNRANIAAQQGDREMQAISALLAGLSALG